LSRFDPYWFLKEENPLDPIWVWPVDKARRYMKRPTMIQGSCFCGQCSFEALGELFDVLNCHCSICRKLTGATFQLTGLHSQGSVQLVMWSI